MQPRTPVAKIYSDVIIPDFLDAGTKLPQSYTGTEVGSGNQGRIKSNSRKSVHDGKGFCKSRNCSGRAYYCSLYLCLLPNYNDLFDYTKNEHHSEYIFDIEYEEGLGGLGSPFTRLFMPNVTAMLNYYKIVGGFKESLCPTMSFINLWNAADKRKDVSILCCGQWKNPTTGVVTIF
jgi:hypothetical protein